MSDLKYVEFEYLYLICIYNFCNKDKQSCDGASDMALCPFFTIKSTQRDLGRIGCDQGKLGNPYNCFQS